MNFRQLLSNLLEATTPSVNIQCGRETFRQIPSTFGAASRPTVNIRPFSMRLGDLQSNFGPSLNDMFQDRMVCGINKDQMQNRLVSEPKLSMESAAEQDSAHPNSQQQHSVRQVTETEVYPLFTLPSSWTKPWKAVVEVDEIPLEMGVDTGASLLLVSEET